MESRNLFHNLSPLDHRYYLANRELFDRLSSHLSEEAVIRSCLEVEVALLLEVAAIVRPAGLSSGQALEAELRRIVETIEPEEVYREEETTRHNVRALVNVLVRRVAEPLKPLVHLGATSVDILDTAGSLRIRGAVRRVVLPELMELEESLITRTLEEADTPQVGRTHGQFAVPITFGFALAEYTSRLGKAIERIEAASRDLRGKLAGAVGAYNALSLITPDPEALERRVLARLGLEPSEHSTQLVEPEYQLRLMLEINTAFGVIANLADDLRNLQRSEIGEVREGFGQGQVGSSTMPHKRNPWNSEHVKSLWKAFSPRVATMFMDQISEHQRDLTNSASARFTVEFLAGFAAAVSRMKRVLKGLVVDRDRMATNLRQAGDMPLAEPLYVLLSLSGRENAHETLRQATLRCEREKVPLAVVLREEPELWETLTSGEMDARQLDALLADPSRYRGIAAQKAQSIARRHQESIAAIRKELAHD